MRKILLGTACAAALAAPAAASEINDYVSHAPDTDHPGREYVANGVRVVEGQPRWSTQRRTVITGSLDTPVDRGPVLDVIDMFRTGFWR